MLNTVKSEELYKIALDLMPGGVNSPVRAFGAVGRNPLFIDHAKGSYVYDPSCEFIANLVCIHFTQYIFLTSISVIIE